MLQSARARGALTASMTATSAAHTKTLKHEILYLILFFLDISKFKLLYRTNNFSTKRSKRHITI